MKIYFFVLCLIGVIAQKVHAQKNSNTSALLSFDRTVLLEEKSDTTANVGFGDFDGDGHLDILLVKGRHWPIFDRVLLGDGRGGIRKAYNLGKVADRSYAGGLADFNGDGFLDIAISNDNPDRKLIYLNDGKGNFAIGSEFGSPEWPTRNLSVADINSDGLPDLILANRGNASAFNYICLNQGKGQFTADCIRFARYPSTTITPADFTKDGSIDLVVPHRNGGQSYVYLNRTDNTFSDIYRTPFGPPDATIRVTAVADFDGDSLLDIVTVDENKGVNLYFGQKDQTFSPGISLADAKVVPYALAIADMNNDKKMDIIVGHEEGSSTLFLNDGTGRIFIPISFGDSIGTVYGFAIGDFNEDGTADIAAARSDAPNVLYVGSLKSKNRK
jgi:hypothetical protein